MRIRLIIISLLIAASARADRLEVRILGAARSATTVTIVSDVLERTRPERITRRVESARLRGPTERGKDQGMRIGWFVSNTRSRCLNKVVRPSCFDSARLTTSRAHLVAFVFMTIIVRGTQPAYHSILSRGTVSGSAQPHSGIY